MANNDTLGKLVPYIVLGGVAIYGINKFGKPIGDTIGGFGSGVSDVAGGVGDAVQGIGSGISEVAQGVSAPFGFADKFFETGEALLDKFKERVQTYYPSGVSIQGNTTQELIDQGQTIYGISGGEIVSNVEAQARSVRNKSGKNVSVTPFYDPKTGKGVSSSGQGYSSAFNLGAGGTNQNTRTGTSSMNTSSRSVKKNIFNSGYF